MPGDLAGYSAASLTGSERITLVLALTDNEITLIEIATHDDIYR